MSAIAQSAKNRPIWGRFFVHFFRGKSLSAENSAEFLKKQFFKTFSAENSIFSQHFWGKIFREIFRGIFPGKNVRKIGPWSRWLHHTLDQRRKVF
jgi:hypothetical protein